MANRPHGLQCDMSDECREPITHIGEKGWIYCAKHAPARHGWERVRRLRPFELQILKAGDALPSYAPLSKAETMQQLAARGEV